MSGQRMQKIGVVGLGLMGSSIIVSLLNAGYSIVAMTPLPEEKAIGGERIQDHLNLCNTMGMLKAEASAFVDRYIITDDYKDLTDCELVVECVIEIEEIKSQVYQQIENVVSDNTIIASNTSALPISLLQGYLKVPNRFLGIHWAEPAYATRFLEITCGALTDKEYAQRIHLEAENWEKEPTLLYKDIRGFITNRLMYAVYREAFHLLNTKIASMEAIDKCFQYDVGSWISIMGLFKRVDYLGLENFIPLYLNLFPKLSNSTEVPTQMQEIAKNKGRGIHNLSGLFSHDVLSAQKLDQSFAQFNVEIYRLVEKYREKKQELNL